MFQYRHQVLRTDRRELRVVLPALGQMNAHLLVVEPLHVQCNAHPVRCRAPEVAVEFHLLSLFACALNTVRVQRTAFSSRWRASAPAAMHISSESLNTGTRAASMRANHSAFCFSVPIIECRIGSFAPLQRPASASTTAPPSTMNGMTWMIRIASKCPRPDSRAAASVAEN